MFEFELKNTLTNQELPEETSESIEKVMKLRCDIHNDDGKAIDTLQDGINHAMVGSIEKNSINLGRDAIWLKKSQMHSAPRYLCINFIRFYWKAEAESSGTKAGKAKILRRVVFPKVLDIYEYCSDELKAKLMEGRNLDSKLREEEDNKALTGQEEEKKEDNGDVDMKDESKPAETADGTSAAGAAMNSKQQSDQEKLVGAKAKAAWVMENIKKHDAALYKPHGTGKATGNYEIIGLVTHKGRSADGGHYIGWAHASGDDWVKCDDDLVT